MFSTDVLVIGAGPSGSAAAIALARSGHRVVLADRHEFPRDKACGDALIPDALAAIRRLDLESEVRRHALTVRELRVFSPNRTQVTLRGDFACQPRVALDAVLQQAAVEAGATFVAPCKLVSARTAGDAVAGATFSHARTGERIDIQARVTLLATGAAAEPLITFGVCTRPAPSAIAARAYYQVPENLAARSRFLAISFDRAIRPGYGWVFPGPDNIFNVGVGVFRDSTTAPATVNLRELWRVFLSEFELAATIASQGTKLGDLKGAPLRTAMTGADFHRAGLLVLGEAAGLTFSFSGEGIGKAMESGLLAGQLVHEHLADRRNDVERLGLAYAAALQARFAGIFRNYRLVQDWLSWPSVCNLIAWRATRSAHVRRRLEGMLSESVDPRELFSLTGLLKSL